jgi:2-iminoacetate synthase ThiH
VSALVEQAIDAAGLRDLADARREGNVDHVRGAIARLFAADLLALGALADRVRADEVGDVVTIFADVDADEGLDVVEVRALSEGLAFLRATAIARITGPRGARVRVDWTTVGLEIAQVALGFGANELKGRIATKRGLPIAESEMSGTGKRSEMQPMQLVKKKELEGLVARSGRKAVFVERKKSETLHDHV